MKEDWEKLEAMRSPRKIKEKIEKEGKWKGF